MMIILQGIKIEKITVWIILSCNHLDRNQRIFHHAHDESRRLYRKGRIELIEKPIPSHGPNDALLKITTTTICGTDIHILKGEYAVPHGLTVGHEPVGIIENSGAILKALKKGSERWPAPFAPRLRPMPAVMVFPLRTVPICRNAVATDTKRRRGGVLAMLSMARRLSMCWYPMPKQIWR